MSTGPRLIQQDMVPVWFPTFPSDLEPFLAASNPLYAGFYQDQPACIAGFVPQQRSGEALLWGWTTPLIDAHPLVHARWARRLIDRVHPVYPTIVGYCAQSKLRWIRLLGGRIAPAANGYLYFTIEAPQ